MTRRAGMVRGLARGLVVAAPLVVVLAFPAFAAALEQTLAPADPGETDQFGGSVAVDGDTAVVGASVLNAVYVFTRSGDSWVQTAKLTASDGPGSLGESVAIDGDTIVSGATGADGRGAVYTFARTGAAERTQTAKLTASDGAASDALGWSVAIDGDTIVAGAAFDDVGVNPNQGSVYTFARTGAAERTQTAKLTASDGGAEDQLGRSVAIDGDTIVAGAPRDVFAASQGQGAAYTFARSGAAARTQTAKLAASDGGAEDQLGASVAIDGDTIVAGAPSNIYGANPGQGAAYTFARTGAAARTPTARLTASDGGANDQLGASVAVDGDTIVAGAPGLSWVYSFARAGEPERSETAKLATRDGLGVSVAIDGDTVIAGSTGVSPSSGGLAVIIFSPAPPPPVATCSGEPATIVPADGQTVIMGTSGADVIIGADTGERIDGRGGDDLICAGKGDDRVRGGKGDDKLRGGGGRDRVFGGRGDDLLVGGAGNDELRGGRGKDRTGGGNGQDRVYGGSGNDRLDEQGLGGNGRDRLFGGSGNDRVRTADGTADTVDCGRGRDRALIDTNDHQMRCERVEQKLTAADGTADDQLGRSVAVDGDTAVVGAPGANEGAVYVFARSGDSWVQTAKLTASDAEGVDEQLGASVAIDGDTIVAGAPSDDVGANPSQGSVYTFARTGAAERAQTAKLTASDGAEGDRLGYSVAIDGDTIVAGAPSDDVGRGSVYTFTRTGAAERAQTAKLTASDGAAEDQLGASVAIDGDTIVAGAPFNTGGATNQGSVYTFARTGDPERTQTAKLTASDADEGDLLGVSVAIDGDTIVVGAFLDYVGANDNQGSAYTFARTGAAERAQTAKLTASDGAEGDRLGYSVAIDGDTIVAGALSDDVGANVDQGSVYTFARTGGPARTQTAKLTASDGTEGDTLGYSVAIDGDTIIVGVPSDDVGANVDQGSAWIPRVR